MTNKTEETREEVQENGAEKAVAVSPRVRLGESLSRARQTRDISIAYASERLRIRTNYLEALESGDWTPLPEDVYVMGFLRQYASLLCVDITHDIEALKTGEYQLTKPFTMPDLPIAMNRTWAIAAGTCFVLLLILFNVVDEGEKEQMPPPSTLSLTEPQSAPDPALLPIENAPDADPAMHDVPAAPEMPTGEPPVTPADEKPAALPPATLPVVIEPVPAASPAAKAGTAQFADQVKPEIPAIADKPVTDSHDYQISAVDEDVWLQVHTPEGNLLKEALLRSGQSLRLSSAADFLLLTAGNPLALEVSIDDRIIAETGTLGEKEKVLRDHHLTPTNSGSAR